MELTSNQLISDKKVKVYEINIARSRPMQQKESFIIEEFFSTTNGDIKSNIIHIRMIKLISALNQGNCPYEIVKDREQQKIQIIFDVRGQC